MSSLAEASIYADETPPPVAVKTVSSSEIELVDGMYGISFCMSIKSLQRASQIFSIGHRV